MGLGSPEDLNPKACVWEGREVQGQRHELSKIRPTRCCMLASKRPSVAAVVVSMRWHRHAVQQLMAQAMGQVLDCDNSARRM